MHNPYVQVALTYVWRFARPTPDGFFAVTLGLLMFVHGLLLDDHTAVATAFCGALILDLLVVAHLKEQVASSRAQVWPRYRRIHLTVALALSAAIFGGLLVELRCTHGVATLGTAAALAILLAGIFWCVASGPGWLTVIFLAVLLAARGITPVLRLIEAAVLRGEYEWGAAAVLAGAVACFAIALRRLARLNEEMPQYHRQFMTSQYQLRARSTGESAAAAREAWRMIGADWFHRVTDQQMLRLRQSAPEGIWARAQRWRLGGSRSAPWAIGLILAAGNAVFLLLLRPNRWPQRMYQRAVRARAATRPRDDR